MLRTLITVLAAASLVAAAAAQEQQQPPEQTVFRGGSELVRAYVTVTDRNGRLVTTLRQEDFEVRDEGKTQPVTLFVNLPRAIRLIVLLDVSGSMLGNLPLLRSGTAELVKHLRADDVARVGTFGKEVVISETFTRDARELVGALPSAIDPQAPTPLWRAIDKAIESFGRPAGSAEGEARHVVLVLSDGADSGLTSFRDRFVTQGDVIDRARRQDVMIYAVGMRSRGNRSAPGLGIGGLQAALSADLPDPQLARVAEETGGGYTEINFGDNLGLAFAQVAEELHSQYLLAYEPPRRDGKVHEIEVRVKQGGMKPRARKSYVAPKG
ncbi:MAG TPA: VWA domain-containing protein [Vicinamibacterales bacterium]|nr:VWA domain-containing protein [Vicinamibacterales bacterium]